MLLPPDHDANPNNDNQDVSPTLAAVLGPALLLPKIALQQLFALPGDAVPQAITRLTGLTQDDVCRFAAFSTPEEYAQALRHEAARFYYYALAGWLAYQSALGAAIRARLRGAGTAATADTVAAAELITEGTVTMLEGCVPTPTRATVEALHALFEQEKHGLVPCLPALVAEAPAPDPEADEVWITIRPTFRELHLFGMALYLTHAASYGVPHRLGEALPAVAALGPPAELIALARRCKAAEAEAEPTMDLTGADIIRLYLSLQVLALLCVADLQAPLLQRLNPEPDSDEPWADPEQQQAFVGYACTQVEAIGRLFDDLFGEEPAYQAAKATARELAALV